MNPLRYLFAPISPSKSSNPLAGKHAFTLIELLIVLAIIGILMGLLFPAVNGALDSARKAQAKNDVVQIANAVIFYETEYGKLPGISGTNDYSGNVSLELVQTLTGESTNFNPRKIVFMEVQAAKKNKSGTNSSGFVDPWGNPYKISIDGNYNNEITVKGNATIRKKVGVWNEPTNNPNRRAVTSWD